MDLFSLFDEMVTEGTVTNNMEKPEAPMEMVELVAKMNAAAEAYTVGREFISDREYDAMFDKLSAMEKETGVVLPDSPTHNVGAKVVSKLVKVTHEYPALSLDKTKIVSELKDWLSTHKAMLSWKMDGLTIVLTYDDGKLTRAVTRGNGIIGEDITHNAVFFKGIPKRIPHMGHLVVRGEAVMTYTEFERINANLPDVEKYKNPRNLASGTVRALDGNVCKEREISFYAFQVVTGMETDSFSGRLDILDGYGFQTVERVSCTYDTLETAVIDFKEKIPALAYPTDGLVLEYDSVSYGESLGSTGHHPRYGMAFKWEDAIARTVLRDIEWSASRTGLLNPVAVFDAVELEGTTVERASLHNVSYIMENDLRIGDEIGVYKANMIIPQVGENFSTSEERQKVKGTHLYKIATVCPVCGQATSLQGTDLTPNGSDTITLVCTNPNCSAKMVGKFVHFCERDCMNIDGMSEKTLERFLQEGFVKSYADLWHLDRCKEKIVAMEGFGQKSYDKLVESVEKARTTDFVAFIHSCGIANIGKGQAKLLKNHLVSVFEEKEGIYFENGAYNLVGLLAKLRMNEYDFSQIEGFGEVIVNSLNNWVKTYLLDSWMENIGGNMEIMDLLHELTFTDMPSTNIQSLAGKVFVITGSLNGYANRDELVVKIESLGGKVSGSVSAKTSYLINNDVNSTTGKNKKAKELGIPIISEADFESLIIK